MSKINEWTLQETSGTTVADFSGSNTGTIDGSVTLGVTGPGSGFPLAADFSGNTTTPITLASTVQLASDEYWKLGFWAKQDADDVAGMILGDRNNSTSFVWLSGTFGALRVRSVSAADYDFAVPASTRTNWAHYELVHDVSGANPTLRLTVNGAVIGTAVAASGVALDINTLGGGYSNPAQALNGQIAGLQIEDAASGFDPSSPDKVILVIGQSNAAGRFNNHQISSHPTLKASVFESGAWAELIDTGTYGEVWPLLATRWMADRNESVGFIYAALGGTGLVSPAQWADSGSAYNAAIAAVAAAGVSNVDAMVWFQGEADSFASVSRSAYAAAMDELVSRLHADLPGTPPLICGQLNYTSSGTVDEIRQAQVDSWSNASIYPGPVTYDIGPLSDNLHFKTDAEAVIFADRWWAAIDEALFDGTVGTPPSLNSVELVDTTLTLNYDRDLEAVTNYTTNAWVLDDDGNSIAVTAASKTGARTVELTLAVAPASENLTLSLGSGASAWGADVPRGLGGQPALPEAFAVTVGEVVVAANLAVREIISVKQMQRVISIR